MKAVCIILVLAALAQAQNLFMSMTNSKKLTEANAVISFGVTNAALENSCVTDNSVDCVSFTITYSLNTCATVASAQIADFANTVPLAGSAFGTGTCLIPSPGAGQTLTTMRNAATRHSFTCDISNFIVQDGTVELDECFSWSVTKIITAGGSDSLSEFYAPPLIPTKHEYTIDGSEAGAIVLLSSAPTDESSKKLTFTVGLSHNTEIAVSGTIGYTEQTATAADFTNTPTPFAFAAGSTKTSTTMVDVVLLDDGIQELVETFGAIATPTSTSKFAASTMNTVTIQDNNEGFRVSVLDRASLEGDVAFIQVQLSHPISFGNSVEMTIATSAGSAKDPEDYTVPIKTLRLQNCPSTSPIALNTCSQSAQFSVNVVNDALVEFPETFSVTLLSTVAPIGTANKGAMDSIFQAAMINPLSTLSGTYTINSDELATIFIDGPQRVDEAAGAKFSFNVVLSHSVQDDMDFAVRSGAGNCENDPCNGMANIYQDLITSDLQQVVTIKANTKNRVFDVRVVNDNVQESQETFTVEIVQGNTQVSIKQEPSKNIGYLNDDEKPFFTITDSQAQVGVPNPLDTESGSRNAVFTVTLSHRFDTSVNVDWTSKVSTPASALARLDFVAQTTTLSFPAFTATNTAVVSVVNDSLEEGQETFIVSLGAVLVADTKSCSTATTSGVACYVVPTIPVNPNGGAVGTISEFKGEGTTLSLTTSTVQTSEKTASVVFTVTLSHPVSSALAVNYKTVDGSATAGEDFTATSGTITFPATLQTALSVPPSPLDKPKPQTITVALIDDQIVEASETFSVVISVSDADALQTTGFLPGGNSAVITIISDDTATVTVASAQATEKSEMLKFVVSLSHAVQGRTDVTFISSQFVGLQGVAVSATADSVKDSAAATVQATKCQAGHGDFVTVGLINKNDVLSIPKGLQEYSFGVRLVNDNCQEEDETFQIEIVSVAAFSEANLDKIFTDALKVTQSVTLGATNTKATGTITDNEGATVSIDESVFAENSGSSRMLVTSSHMFDYAVDVNFAFSDSETSGATVDCTGKASSCVVDFAVTFPAAGVTDPVGAGRVRIAPFSFTSPVMVNIIDDNLVERTTETASVVLTTSSSFLTAGKPKYTMSITDNEVGTVFVQKGTADEAVGTALNFKVFLSHPVQTDVSFNYATSEPADVACATCGCCATANQDYVAVVAGKGKINAGDTFGTVSVKINNDDIQECDESFQLSVTSIDVPAVGDLWTNWGAKSSPLSIQAAQRSAIGSIVDMEPGFAFMPDTVAVSAKEGAGSLTWKLALSHKVSKDSTLQWATSDDGWETSDLRAGPNKRYTSAVSALATNILFPADKATATVNPTVVMRDDQFVSPDQSFKIILTPLGGSCSVFHSKLPVLTGTVQDDESATISIADKKTWTEGSSAALVVSLSHSLGAGSHPEFLNVAWGLDLSNPSNSASVKDFTAPLTGAITPAFTGAIKTATVSLAVKTDDICELNQNFGLTFSPSAAFVNTLNTFVNWNDISSPNQGTIKVTVVDAVEAQTQYIVKLDLDVDVDTAFDTLLVCTKPDDSGDLKAVNQAITFQGVKGESKNVVVPFGPDDFVVELAKDFAGLPCTLTVVDSFYAKLISVVGGTFNAKVADDDVAFLTVSAAQSATEGEPIFFTAMLSKTVDTDVTIKYYTTVGTASAADFESIDKAAAKSVTIPKGSTAFRFAINTKKDALIEAAQTFNVVFDPASLSAAKRNIDVSAVAGVGTILDVNSATLSVKVLTATVDEGQKISFKVDLNQDTTEEDMDFSYTLKGVAMDRNYNSATLTDAVYCVDFAYDHCTGVVQDAAKLAKPLIGTIRGGSSTTTIDIMTLQDGEIDFDNLLTFDLADVLQSPGKITMGPKAGLTASATIKDLDGPAVWKIGSGNTETVNEAKEMKVTISLKKPFRRFRTFTMTSESSKLIGELDYPALDNTAFDMPGSFKSFDFKFMVPDNQQVVNTETFDIWIAYETKKEISRQTYSRVDKDSVMIALDPTRSVLTNEEGGSGLQIAYRLKTTVRSASSIFFVSGYQGEETAHQQVIFETALGDWKINGKTYKGIDMVTRGTRTLFYADSGSVVFDAGTIRTTSTQTKETSGFPAVLTLTSVNPLPVFVPELCQQPMRTGPVTIADKSKNKNVFVYITPGESNTIYPGSCFYYPEGTASKPWTNQYKITAAGPATEICNPVDKTMCVVVTVVQGPQRQRIVLADQKDTPITLILNDQIDLDVEVADNLFLYQCNVDGRSCCNNVGGENIITKCSVDTRAFRSSDPVWATNYDYDVSGTVRISVQARMTGLSKQCFGFAPADDLYPNGFCLQFYVPETPIAAYTQKQVVVQGTSVVTPLHLLGGTWFDRTVQYNLKVYCVRNCQVATASVSVKKGQWSVTILGSDVNIGDAQFIAVVQDKYYYTASYPIDVRVVRTSHVKDSTCTGSI